MSRRQHAHVPQQGCGLAHGAVGQKQAQALGIDGPFHPPRGQQRLAFRSEHERLAARLIQQRFDAERVPGQQHRFPARPPIQHGQGEHAAQPGKAGLALFLVEPQQDFRIALGAEAMAPVLEPGAQFPKIIDFPVEDEGDAAVLGHHGLMSGRGQILDGQPGHAEHGPARARNPPVVGTAMAHGRHHGRHGVPVRRRRSAACPCKAANTAHQPILGIVEQFHIQGIAVVGRGHARPRLFAHIYRALRFIEMGQGKRCPEPFPHHLEVVA